MKKVNKKKIIIVGASGFIGRNLLDKLNKANKHEVIGTYFNNYQKNLIKYNHHNEKSNEKLFLEEKPDIIIWCSGLKNLQETETSNSKALKENFYPIKFLSNYLKNFSKTKFIYISTDYVFSGEKGNYKFDDKPSPNTNYGKSKLEAEKFIRKNFPFYLIVRTSAVIGKGSSFFDWIYNSMLNHNKIELYSNIFTPTSISFLVEEIENLLFVTKSNIYHICGNVNMSRFDLGLIMAKCFEYDLNLILKKETPKNSNFKKNLSLKSSVKSIHDFSIEKFIQSEFKKYKNN